MGEFNDKLEQFKQQFQNQDPKQDLLNSGSEGAEDNQKDSSQSLFTNEQELPDQDQEQLEQEPVRSQPRERKRHTNTYKKQINRLTYENRIKDQQLIELAERTRQQEYLLSQQNAALENEKEYKNAYYENNLQTREVSIINELKAAKEEGDVEKEIALSKALAQVTAEQATYGLYKNQLAPRENVSYDPGPMESNIYPAPYIGGEDNYQDDYEDPISEVAADWLDVNSWANPNSRDYSPRLRSELDSLASELDETLRYNGHANMIGTPEYFDSLDNLMAERYSVNSPASQQSSRSAHAVAPVSRRGSSMADQYIANNSTRRGIPLNNDEYEIVRNLQIKGPDGQWIQGGDLALKRFLEIKKKSATR